MVKGTNLGAALLQDIDRCGRSQNKVRQPDSWREMKMIMILKPGKEQSSVRGWRTIVLANTVGKAVRGGGSGGATRGR